MNTCLLLIDCQNDFIEGGTLPVTGAKAKMEALCDYLKANAAYYDHIFVTQDWHPADHCSFTPQGGQWPVHCVAHTPGAALFPPLQELLDTLADKVTLCRKGQNAGSEEYSIFNLDSAETPRNADGQKILDYITTHKTSQIDVCGIAGDICVHDIVSDLRRLVSTDTFIKVLAPYCPSLDGGTKLQALKQQLSPIGHRQIITHFTDDDLYTFTVMYYILMNYPTAEVRYNFFDRNHEVYPAGFAAELQRQVNNMRDVVITDEEIAFMQRKCYYLPEYFFVFLRGFRYNPAEVHISQDAEGHLDIVIEGKWYSAVKWEMMLLATISELCHNANGDTDLFLPAKEYARARDKAGTLLSEGLLVADMGTRRRLSFSMQDVVIRAFVDANAEGHPGRFTGTSNVWFAMKYDITPIGTMSHQIIEAEEVMSGVFECNYQVMKKWNDTYNGYLGTFLCDCFGENAYFRNVNRQALMLFDGIRIDSGDEIDQMNKHIAKYREYAIDPTTKTIIFSNALTGEKAISIHRQVNGQMKDSYGIGTWLMCNFDATSHAEALPIKNKNIVVKLVGFRYSLKHDWCDCVKLSCDEGKTLGNSAKCAYLLSILK